MELKDLGARGRMGRQVCATVEEAPDTCRTHPDLARAGSSHREDQPKASVPCPCQNGRKTAVASGHSRTPRMASDLGMGRLTHCVKHTSKQWFTW